MNPSYKTAMLMFNRITSLIALKMKQCTVLVIFFFFDHVFYYPWYSIENSNNALSFLTSFKVQDKKVMFLKSAEYNGFKKNAQFFCLLKKFFCKHFLRTQCLIRKKIPRNLNVFIWISTNQGSKMLNQRKMLISLKNVM